MRYEVMQMFNFDSPRPAGRLGVEGVVTDKEFIEKEIRNFKASRRRAEMLAGEDYYVGSHDILRKKRTAIGDDGELVEVKNLPNNRIVDNQYRKLALQKSNYLLGRPVSFKTEDEVYAKLLAEIFDMRTQRRFKTLAKKALNQGIAWLMPCYDADGTLAFRFFNGYEIRPGWRDAEHTMLDYAIRLYSVISYSGKEEEIVEKVEVYDEAGVSYFTLDDGTLKPEEPFRQPYFFSGDTPVNWTRIPLVAFKRDEEETPLLRNVKSLQDGLNTIESAFQDNMQEDTRSTILILKNYDGENLGKFRQNLATYGAVKVRTVDGSGGDVDKLSIEVNAENYKAILDIFRRAIIENGMGYDAKDERMKGSPNQMNIQSMYSDIDLDANDMETEFQAAMEELLWFVRAHLANTGRGNFDGAQLEVIFNRDTLINEGEVIENIIRSEGLLSEETLIASHPWVDDPTEEMKRLEKQRKKEAESADVYGNAFRKNEPLRKGEGGDG